MADGVSAPAPTSPGVPTTSDAGVNVDSGNEGAGSPADDYITPEEMARFSKRKLKHKVDGKEVEATFEDTIKGYSHSRAANERMEAAANERKAAAQERLELNQQLAKLKDPKEARALLQRHLGEEGFSQMAHEVVSEALRLESMTPEEIQAEKDARELEDFRSKGKREAEEVKAVEHKKAVEKFTEELGNDLEEFVSKLDRKPQPHELESMLGIMLNCFEKGHEVPLQDVWNYVQQQEKARWDRYLSKVDVAKLPAEFIEKVRQHSVSELPNFRSRQTQTPQVAPQKADTVDATDFFKNMRK